MTTQPYPKCKGCEKGDQKLYTTSKPLVPSGLTVACADCIKKGRGHATGEVKWPPGQDVTSASKFLNTKPVARAAPDKLAAAAASAALKAPVKAAASPVLAAKKATKR